MFEVIYHLCKFGLYQVWSAIKINLFLTLRGVAQLAGPGFAP